MFCLNVLTVLQVFHKVVLLEMIIVNLIVLINRGSMLVVFVCSVVGFQVELEGLEKVYNVMVAH